MAHPPADIDVLLTEGTNLGSDKPVKTESELEDDFVGFFERTRGCVLVAWSGQNIDRTVTLYRAAKRTGRTLAIDLYTADVLDRISEGTRLPRAGWPNLKVIVTGVSEGTTSARAARILSVGWCETASPQGNSKPAVM